MLGAFSGLHPVWQVLLATGFTYGMTARGASLVFFTKEIKRWVLDAMLASPGGL